MCGGLFGPLATARASDAVKHPAAAAKAGLQEPVSDAPPAEAKKAGLPQFDISKFPTQLFWLAISFGVMFFAMTYVALPGVEGGMQRRADYIHGLLHEAKQLKDNAENFRHQGVAATDDAVRAAHDILNKVTTELAQQAADQNHVLESQIQMKQQEAETRIAAARANAAADVREIALDLVPQILDRVAKLGTNANSIANTIDATTENYGSQLLKGAA